MLPVLEEALTLARRRGDRQWLDKLTAAAITESAVRGRWDEAEVHAQEYDPSTLDVTSLQAHACLAELAWQRGEDDESRIRLDRSATGRLPRTGNGGSPSSIRRTSCIVDGRLDEALETALEEVAMQLEPRAGHVDRARASPGRHACAARRGSRAGGAHTRRRQGCLRRGRSRAVTATTARLDGVLATLRGDQTKRPRASVSPSPQLAASTTSLGWPRSWSTTRPRSSRTTAATTPSRFSPRPERSPRGWWVRLLERSKGSSERARAKSAHELTKARSPDSANRRMSSAREGMSSFR